MTIKYNVILSTKFKKDLKRCKKSGLDIDKLLQVVHLIECGVPLPSQFHDHALQGEFLGSRECHIQPDWLLIYEIDNGDLVLALVRTGSHANLFGM